MTTTTNFTKEIRYNRENRDHDMFLDGQYIGSRSTYRQAEIDLDQHAIDLLSSDLCIPATELNGACGDCGATLDSTGLCGCRAEQEPTPEQQAQRDAENEADMDEWLRGSMPASSWHCPDCGDALYLQSPCSCGASVAPVAETPHRISCACGRPALIIEPHGTFCGACHEAQGLWQLWKTDSTAFVAELRRQSCRLNEMAARLCVWLNAKNGSALGCDSILAMWRQLLDDGEPPKPRFYVVAARRVAA